MDPLENNKQIPSPTIPCPTVSLLCPISSPSAFVNTNIGCITEHNERQHNYNSNDTSEDEDEEEDEEDEDEGEENNARDKVKAISVRMSDTQQQTSPNLNNYQGTSTKSETNPVDINMEANQDPIFEGEIEVISKEAFLKNITVANRHLSLVIDNPSLPLYIQGKVKEAIDLLRVDEEKVITGQPLPLDSNIKIGNSALLNKRKSPKNKQVLKNKKTFIAALETSSGQDNNVLTVDNSGIIPDSQSICISNPEIQAPQSLVEAQIPSQDVLIATLGNIYRSKSSSWQITLGSILALVKNRNGRIEGVDLPNYLPSGIEIKSNYGTSISQWIQHLEDAGLDMFTAKSNNPFFSDKILNTTMLLDSNSPVGHLTKNIHDIVCIMRPISNPPVSQRMIWANLLFESFHLVARDIIAPATFEPQKVTTDNPLSVECALAEFLASCFSFNKN
ncbi:hypothetical protein BY996DRAFT_6409213 [Phakopsora pachyrhizi]|nr:hypothetical protein BY996DRAFT_6409213 [Phakopsora pachyrhizi]